MNRILTPLLLLVLSVSCVSTGNKHLITRNEFRELVHRQFLAEKELASGRDTVLFSVFNQKLTQAETEGLEFLYAFMPLSDLAVNDGPYYLNQVRTALEAREFFPWGDAVPETVFLHFVLPYRVNNEYTDTARQVFFRELKDRIKDMNMAQAALEVNHWCHEKVNYKSTDERTSGPLTSVRTAYGRCGEESTFTVAALRSVGIPARQVYTPRWAHTDDNHAWVEVWVDGKWHFMGACEPEPALDMAWFAEPVRRAMMTHTFVFGRYGGNEEVLDTNSRFTRLNLLANYTKTKNLPVKVLDSSGKPVEKARVDFSLYNYAEFYPIAVQYTGRQGSCRATTGLGDLLIWASKDGAFDYKVARAQSEDTVVLELRRHDYLLPDEVLTFTPPVKQELPAADESQTGRNNQRLQQEDSIRDAYIRTFIDSASAVALATGKGLKPAEVWSYLANSRGNWKEIKSFIEGLNGNELRTGMQLLSGISEKDLHDTRAAVLNDHLHAFEALPAMELPSDSTLTRRYVLAPRIGREFVTPWRSYIRNYFSGEKAESFRANPVEIMDWISASIRLDSVSNYYGVPLNPEGVLQLGVADAYSRDLLFVAICRSFGIPARLEPATRIPQFMTNAGWNDVMFGRKQIVQGAKGTVELRNASGDPAFVPQYYIHFTLAKLSKGRFVTLDYETDESLKTFPCKLNVDTGYYRLITGNRQSDGSVVCSFSYFRVGMNREVKVPVKIVPAGRQAGVLGKADMKAGFIGLGDNKPAELNQFANASGIVVALIDPGKEPTKHLMEDLKTVRIPMDKWGGQFVFIIARDKLPDNFSKSVYSDLPEKSVFGYDNESEIAASVKTVCSINGMPRLPLVVLINPEGLIVWSSEGYNIGLGDQLVKQIKSN